MRAWAQREAFAEEAECHVVVAGAARGGQRNLVRPLPIDRAFAELAFAVDHDTSRVGRRPRSTRRPGASQWFANATNGIGEIFARVFRAKDTLCINDTCVNVDQLKALLAAPTAAGAPALGAVVDEAPSGSSTSGPPDADTVTSTTPSSEDEAGGAAGTAGTQTDAATGSEPGSAEAESGQPTVAPQDDSTATAEPAEADAEQELAPANDNAPVEPTPATGTDG